MLILRFCDLLSLRARQNIFGDNNEYLDALLNINRKHEPKGAEHGSGKILSSILRSRTRLAWNHRGNGVTAYRAASAHERGRL
jgi:hypothetical protein